MTRLARGENTRAQASLLRYIELGGPAAPFARLRLAEVASRRGDADEAIRQIKIALAQPLPPDMEIDARFALAREQERAGDTASATAAYGRLSIDAESASDRAEALWLLASISGRNGETQTYQRSLYSLATLYPWHLRALAALALPQLAPSPVLSPAERAVVLFRHRLNSQAAAAFQASLAEQPGPEGQALAHYHLGILAERAGDPDSALAEYRAARAALEANPAHQLFARASWEYAFLLESLGRLEEAVLAYTALADAAPRAEEAPEALFRAGLARFGQGRLTDAILLWGRYLSTAAEPPAEARARFWLAKAAALIGASDAAVQHLADAAAAAPLDYYGLRARALVAGEEPPAEPQAGVQPPALDWSTIEEWLFSWAGPEDQVARLAFFQGEEATWPLALELARTGLQAEAESVFADLLDQAATEPWLLYRMARDLSEEAQVSLTARAAARLVGGRPDPPRALLALAYPPEYLNLATTWADEYGFPPLLLLALVRQESFYIPDAVSSANALGLTQVIPSTAQEIAGQLAETDFQNSDLFRPRVSLRFGAHYLAAQLDLFDGDLSAALSAYNGGPGSGLRWSETAPDDPDRFLEIIDFSQTHDYVRLVLENYALYRYAYGQAEQPSLPLP
ncbi:MAG: transglycosylase SLT domain-containing protein [Dehalococcoidia bacterium]